jgi:hypothetical protein
MSIQDLDKTDLKKVLNHYNKSLKKEILKLSGSKKVLLERVLKEFKHNVSKDKKTILFIHKKKKSLPTYTLNLKGTEKRKEEDKEDKRVLDAKRKKMLERKEAKVKKEAEKLKKIKQEERLKVLKALSALKKIKRKTKDKKKLAVIKKKEKSLEEQIKDTKEKTIKLMKMKDKQDKEKVLNDFIRTFKELMKDVVDGKSTTRKLKSHYNKADELPISMKQYDTKIQPLLNEADDIIKLVKKGIYKRKIQKKAKKIVINEANKRKSKKVNVDMNMNTKKKEPKKLAPYEIKENKIKDKIKKSQKGVSEELIKKYNKLRPPTTHPFILREEKKEGQKIVDFFMNDGKKVLQKGKSKDLMFIKYLLRQYLTQHGFQNKKHGRNIIPWDLNTDGDLRDLEKEIRQVVKSK